MKKILCILVTYKPNYDVLYQSILSIVDQVTLLIIINNDEKKLSLKLSCFNITILELGKNTGIAHAHNQGLIYAKKNDYDFALLSDQDSIYPNEYIKTLLSAAAKFNNYKVACYAPIFYNTIKKKYENISITKFQSIAISNCTSEFVFSAQVIASGLFIRINSLVDIGLMNEELFIDYVDFEWCWRVNHFNYKIVTLPRLAINHALGDRVKRIAFIQYTIRSSIRYYYMIRNAVFFVFHYPNLKCYEKILFFSKALKYSIGVIVFDNKNNTIRYVARAWKDGLLNKMRKFK